MTLNQMALAKDIDQYVETRNTYLCYDHDKGGFVWIAKADVAHIEVNVSRETSSVGVVADVLLPMVVLKQPFRGAPELVLLGAIWHREDTRAYMDAINSTMKEEPIGFAGR